MLKSNPDNFNKWNFSSKKFTDNIFYWKLYTMFQYHDDILKYLERINKLLQYSLKPWEEVYLYREQISKLPPPNKFDRFFYPISDEETGALENTLTALFLTRTQLLMCGIAAEIYADKLNGKPYPKNLSAYPADPFTGKPFELFIHKNRLVIVSPSEDGKISPDWKNNLDTKEKEYNYQLNDETGTDIFFRLPLEPSK